MMSCHDESSEVSQENRLLWEEEECKEATELEMDANDNSSKNVKEGEEEKEVEMEETSQKIENVNTTTPAAAAQSSAQENEAVDIVATTPTDKNVGSKIEELDEAKDMKCCEDNADVVSQGTQESTCYQTGISQEEAKGDKTLDNYADAKAEDVNCDGYKDDTTTSQEEMVNKTAVIAPQDAQGDVIATTTTTSEAVDNDTKAEETEGSMIGDDVEAKGSEKTGKNDRKDSTTQKVNGDTMVRSSEADVVAVAAGQDDSSSAPEVEESMNKLSMNVDGMKNDPDEEAPQETGKEVTTSTAAIDISQEVQKNEVEDSKTAAVAAVVDAGDKMDVDNTERSNLSAEKADDRIETNIQSQNDEASVKNSESSETAAAAITESEADSNQKTEDDRESVNENSPSNLLSPMPDAADSNEVCNVKTVDSSPTKKKGGFLQRLKQRLSKPKNAVQ